jgi:four helix bundle protein
MAVGSASALEYHRLLARDLRLLDPPQHERLAGEVQEIKRMLTAFVKRLREAPRTKG